MNVFYTIIKTFCTSLSKVNGQWTKMIGQVGLFFIESALKFWLAELAFLQQLRMELWPLDFPWKLGWGGGQVGRFRHPPFSNTS